MKKSILLLLTLTIGLVGCSFKLKTQEVQENEYKSIGNEMEVFGFGIGESLHNIKNIVGGMSKESGSIVSFPKKGLGVFLDHNRSIFLVTSNPDFAVLDDVSVGEEISDVINDHYELDFFRYKPENKDQTFIIFQKDDQKVLLEESNQQIEKIIIGGKDVPLDLMVNYSASEKIKGEYLLDENVLADSVPLTFKINYTRNNKKFLSPDFLGYLKIGLFEDVPTPIGMDKNEVIYRFGSPNYVFKGNNSIDIYYFYDRFNVYMGFDEDNKIIELIAPSSLSIEEFTNAHDTSLAEVKKDAYLDNLEIETTEKDGNIVEFIIRKK